MSTSARTGSTFTGQGVPFSGRRNEHRQQERSLHMRQVHPGTFNAHGITQ
jgi:hypothetical protein